MHDARNESAPIAERLMRLPEVCSMTGLCRLLVYQMQAERRFPQSIKIGVRTVGWLESEVQEWLAERIECSRSGRRQLPEAE